MRQGGMLLNQIAGEIGVCRSTIERICRDNIPRPVKLSPSAVLLPKRPKRSKRRSTAGPVKYLGKRSRNFGSPA